MSEESHRTGKTTRPYPSALLLHGTLTSGDPHREKPSEDAASPAHFHPDAVVPGPGERVRQGERTRRTSFHHRHRRPLGRGHSRCESPAHGVPGLTQLNGER